MARPRTHGMQPAALYRTWEGMHQRCGNPNYPRFEAWGGRGIVVCDEWQAYVPFRGWALANGWRPGLQIDRIDNDGDYEPKNCQFATAKENGNNRRDSRWLTHEGRTMTMAQWAEELGVPRLALNHRLARGWPVEQALTLPIGTRLRSGRRISRQAQ